MAMTKWIPWDGKFSEGDMLRWVEPSGWEKRRKKWVPTGRRAVRAQVIRRGLDRADFEVCESIGDDALSVGETIMRKLDQLMKGRAERAVIGDESTRSILISKHLQPELSELLARPLEGAREPAAGSRTPRRGSAGRRGYLRKGRRKPQLRP
jgi:hypothetical protein